jgi:hypothetical protein
LAVDFTPETWAIPAILERLVAAGALIFHGDIPWNTLAATHFSWSSVAGQHLALFMRK